MGTTALVPRCGSLCQLHQQGLGGLGVCVSDRFQNGNEP